MTTNIRQRFNRKTAALLIAFTIALGGTGISSLAILTDQARVDVVASITTIDLNANGGKTAAFTFQVIPGDIKYVPIRLTNTGTGYVNVTNTALPNAAPITLASKAHVVPNAAAAQCNATDIGTINWGTAGNAVDPIFTGTHTIDGTNGIPGGGFEDYCVVYRFGVEGGSYGLESFTVQQFFDGIHP